MDEDKPTQPTGRGTDGKLNAVSATVAASAAPILIPTTIAEGKACLIDDPTCEACQ